VRVEEDSERDGDDSLASMDPPNIPETPAASTQSPEPPRIYLPRKPVAPEVSCHDEREQFVQPELLATRTANLTKVKNLLSNHKVMLYLLVFSNN